MAWFWDCRPGKLRFVCVRVCCRCEYNARPILWSSMSFSGFGGTGGGGRFVEASEGIGSVNGASMRSGGGGGL